MILMAAFTISPPAFAGCEGFEQNMAALESIVKAPSRHNISVPTAPFAREFVSTAQAQQWAQTSTTGGGHIEEKNFLNEDFIFVFRKYNTGIQSSDAAVYIKEGNKWRFVKAHPVAAGKLLFSERRDDTFLFHARGEEPVMTLDRSDIPGL